MFSCVQLFLTPWTVAHQAPLSRDFPGKNTGVGCHTLLQGIFTTQGFNPCLPCLLRRQVDSLPFELSSEELGLINYINYVKKRVAQLCLTLYNTLQPARLFCPRNSLGENTGVGSPSLFQRIFPAQDQYTSIKTKKKRKESISRECEM